MFDYAALFSIESTDLDVVSSTNKTYYNVNKQIILSSHSAEAAVILVNELVGVFLCRL